MMIPDERLDYLANCFIVLEVGPLLQVTFEQYLQHTQRCDELAIALQQGHGINFDGTGSKIVTIH